MYWYHRWNVLVWMECNGKAFKQPLGIFIYNGVPPIQKFDCFDWLEPPTDQSEQWIYRPWSVKLGLAVLLDFIDFICGVCTIDVKVKTV